MEFVLNRRFTHKEVTKPKSNKSQQNVSITLHLSSHFPHASLNFLTYFNIANQVLSVLLCYRARVNPLRWSVEW